MRPILRESVRMEQWDYGVPVGPISENGSSKGFAYSRYSHNDANKGSSHRGVDLEGDTVIDAVEAVI